MQSGAMPIFLLIACLLGVSGAILALGWVFNPRRPGRVKRMPYESGMDPVHDTRRRFDVRFHLLAIAFLVFDVELLFLYPWAVAVRSGPAVSVAGAAGVGAKKGTVPLRFDRGTVPFFGQSPQAPAALRPSPSGSWAPRPVFVGGLAFIALLTLGFIYDWRKEVFRWR
jgi:NADH-quinone oxidoreductase subunit A